MDKGSDKFVIIIIYRYKTVVGQQSISNYFRIIKEKNLVKLKQVINEKKKIG